MRTTENPAAAPPTTAGIDPARFGRELSFLAERRTVILGLVILGAIAGFVRMYQLGAESLGEDEYNKLVTVEEYRTNGLSGKNGEHPFLMKGLATLSISAAETINTSLSAERQISPEFALRFPVALIGTLTVLGLFLLMRELFGTSIGFVTAALWAVEPAAVSFDRVAKEDSLVLFFFVLACFLWARSQTLAERGDGRWFRVSALMGVAFAAMMASKYYPWLLAIIAGYYNIYEYVPSRKWQIGGRRWLVLLAVMAAAFLVFNPTILFPDTWREMLKFSSESRIGHDSYEYVGVLYPHKMTAWLSGVPWTFYYVFIAVKTSLPVLVLFVAGLPLLFRRRLGDGRYLIAMWAFVWFVPFSVLGGKFTRYFTVPEPLILLSAAVAFCFGVKWLFERLPLDAANTRLAQVALFAALLATPLYNTLCAKPHLRLFTNTIGGGTSRAGSYFPHDEFYDTSTKDVIDLIAAASPGPVTVACETPELFEYYAGRAGRGDMRFVSLSDTAEAAALKAGDIVVLTEGRRYFSNTRYWEKLTAGGAEKIGETRAGGVVSSRIYRLPGPLN